MNHSPLPWKVRVDPLNPNPRIVSENKIIAIVHQNGDFTEPTETNASFIITACNAHEKLIQTLKFIRAVLNKPMIGQYETNLAIKGQIEKALSKAGVKV